VSSTDSDNEKESVLLCLTRGNGGQLFRRQLNKDLDVVVRKVSGHATYAALEPILINLSDEVDDVALLKAELAFVLCLKVVQRLAAWLPSA